MVRLQQGSFDREQVYGDDPAAVARAFRAAKARWIHVVDLDGARTGEQTNAVQVAEILAVAGEGDERPPIQVEVAGGLRDATAVRDALDRGAARVVLGTAALQNPGLVRELADRHGPERIAAALDVRNGRAVGDGWVPEASGPPILDVLARLGTEGITTFVVTAIARDGLLGGPDLALLDQVLRASQATVIASGGVATVDDLRAVRDLGCRGAIVGRAIYDGRIDLAAAIEDVTPTR